jgi:hypothetical protein
MNMRQKKLLRRPADPELDAENELILKRVPAFPPEIKAALIETMTKDLKPVQLAEFNRQLQMTENTALVERIFRLPGMTAQGLVVGMVARLTPEDRKRLENYVNRLD